MEEKFIEKMKSERTNRGKDEAIADIKRVGKCKSHILEIIERNENREKCGTKQNTSTPTQEKSLDTKK